MDERLDRQPAVAAADDLLRALVMTFSGEAVLVDEGVVVDDEPPVGSPVEAELGFPNLDPVGAEFGGSERGFDGIERVEVVVQFVGVLGGADGDEAVAIHGHVEMAGDHAELA